MLLLILGCNKKQNFKKQDISIFTDSILNVEFDNFCKTYPLQKGDFYAVFFSKKDNISIIKYSRKEQVIPNVLENGFIGISNLKKDPLLIFDITKDTISNLFINKYKLNKKPPVFINYKSNKKSYIFIWDFLIKNKKIILNKKSDSIRFRG